MAHSFASFVSTICKSERDKKGPEQQWAHIWQLSASSQAAGLWSKHGHQAGLCSAPGPACASTSCTMRCGVTGAEDPKSFWVMGAVILAGLERETRAGLVGSRDVVVFHRTAPDC